jgi:hypothetical protein
MSSVSGTKRPTFPCAWLERNSDRLSFGFHNLTSSRTTSTTARNRTVRPLTSDKPVNSPVACREPIDSHHVLPAHRIAG